jgi:hypothetical protein
VRYSLTLGEGRKDVKRNGGWMKGRKEGRMNRRKEGWEEEI